MRCIAHRGFAEVHPENTMAAVEGALDAGADGIEVDVRECATGELVVVHDGTVDRVTEATGRVAELSLSTLQSLDVLGTGQGVPTLSAVVDAVPESCLLNVELKETGLGAKLARVVADADCDILVSSFESAALQEVEDVSDLSRAFLCHDLAGGLETATSLGCQAIHPHEQSCARAVVTAAHGAGLRVNAWTIRSRERGAELSTAGVDGLIADAPLYCLD